MNEILTAKEWLEKELPEKDCWYECDKYSLDSLMERYANYRNSMLEGRILEFRRLLREELRVGYGGEIDLFYKINENDLFHEHDIKIVFDKHFNITTEK